MKILDLYETFGRPDSSGVRSGWTGVKAKAQPARANNYPYDHDNTYGLPLHGPSHHGITPKDTDHSIWDDIDEAMGTHMLLTRAYGGHVPGTPRGWSGNPLKPWDGEEMDEDYFTDPVISPLGVEPSEPKDVQALRIFGELMPKDSVWSELLKKL